MPVRAADFEAEVRFIPADKGGRQGQVIQGYRSDIRYCDSEELWMIWPLFLDNNGVELERGTLIPNVSNANFYIINDEFRHKIHRKKIRIGTCFYVCEGRKKVAECKVVKILNLYQDFDES